MEYVIGEDFKETYEKQVVDARDAIFAEMCNELNITNHHQSPCSDVFAWQEKWDQGQADQMAGNSLFYFIFNQVKTGSSSSEKW